MASKGDSLLEFEEILRDVPPEKLDQPCQDDHLCEIARHITDWPALAPLAGIIAPEMEEIRGKWPFSVGGQRIEFMRKWKEKHGRKGTYRKLCKSFWKAGDIALAEKVCDICGQESSRDSESSSDETTDPLESLASKLRITYASQTPDFIALQWPPPPTLKVFNLALIQSEETVRVQPIDESLVRLTLLGNVEGVMKMKNPIKLVDLFRGKSKKRKVVLLEGAPGFGKSTLAYDICQKWEARQLFHDKFKIIIYVQFRHLDPELVEISDLLPIELASDRRAAMSLLKASLGKGVLFILDGWDEYTPGLQQGSLFDKLICHPAALTLERSVLLITSRPIASGNLQKYATSRVEIVGFTPKEVGQYFEDIFKDVQTLQKLHDHLQVRPLIQASCYLPLNAAIVAHLFIELNHTLPTTLHGLFSSLVLSCIIRHLTKELGTEPDVTSLDELSPDVLEIFQNVCIIAYKGVFDNRVVFSTQDLRSYGLPKDFNALSLMQVVQSFATGKPKTYHFLHLSIQELLAAQHISSLPPPEQSRNISELFGQPRFDAVFLYYAAFSNLQSAGIREIVARIVQSAVSDKQEGKVHLLNLMHCLYEACDVSLCHFVSHQLKGTLDLSISTLSPIDLLSLKYFLSCVNHGTARADGGSDSYASDATVSNLLLALCRLTAEDIGSLSLRNLEKVSLSVNAVSCTCAADLLANNPRLKVFQLSGCGLTDEGAEMFAVSLRDHSSLEILDLSHCSNFPYSMHHILQAVINHCSLQSLDVSHCSPEVKDVAAVLEGNKLLKMLGIGGVVITDNDPVHIILSNSLKKNRTLERLEMRLPSRGWEEFVLGLQDCHLKTLGVDEIIDGHSRKVLNQQRDKVNDERRKRGLPLFQIVYTNFALRFAQAIL